MLEVRELEYFDGILFLTTNRPGTLDEAFQSRIHITLNLPELSGEDQLQVWGIMLSEQKLEKGEVDKIWNKLRLMYKDGNHDNLNGRQIRNNVRTAMALAATEAKPENKKLSITHIKSVLDVGKEFSIYMNKLNSMEPRQRAAAYGYRAFVT